jgi:hypothetical protein
LNVTSLDEGDIQNKGAWLKAEFLNYVQQNIKYTTIYTYTHTHNLGYVEVLSDNAISKVS